MLVGSFTFNTLVLLPMPGFGHGRNHQFWAVQLAIHKKPPVTSDTTVDVIGHRQPPRSSQHTEHTVHRPFKSNVASPRNSSHIRPRLWFSRPPNSPPLCQLATNASTSAALEGPYYTPFVYYTDSTLSAYPGSLYSYQISVLQPT